MSAAAGRSAPPAPGRAWLWLALALALGMLVWALNGRLLFYYDSPYYLKYGTRILSVLGLPPADAGSAAQSAAGLGGGDDGFVSGARSAVYSLFSALVLRLCGGFGLVLAQVLLVIASGWLALRVVLREGGLAQSLPLLRALGISLSFAALGSLPFYTAYLMPDIFTPVLLLMAALVSACARHMRPWELALATLLGAAAVTAHISHIPIAALLLMIAVLAGLRGGLARWWLASALILLMLLGGLAERQAFKAAARKVADAEVVYLPYLTARLIEDGPGWRYLQAHCPGASLATCALYEQLSKGSDPMRFTASHIIFETSPQLGSFKHLPPEIQARIAAEQYGFYLRTYAWAPFSTTLAIIRNTLQQAAMNSIGMTIPTDEIVANTHANAPQFANLLDHGRLSRDPSWLKMIDPLHNAVYAISLGLVLWLMIAGGLAAPLRGFALLVILGILANAFVTGALSQPADRYGARAIWLLPFLAALMVQARAARRRGEGR